MPYDRDRVDFTNDDHDLAKEINELFEAIVDRDKSIAAEAIDVVTEALDQFPDATREEKLDRLFKAIVANVVDEFQQRVIGRGTV